MRRTRATRLIRNATTNIPLYNPLSTGSNTNNNTNIINNNNGLIFRTRSRIASLLGFNQYTPLSTSTSSNPPPRLTSTDPTAQSLSFESAVKNYNLSSENFNIQTDNISSGDARGLPQAEVLEIQKLMKEWNVSFDDARLMIVHRRFREMGIDPDTGLPMDAKAVVSLGSGSNSNAPQSSGSRLRPSSPLRSGQQRGNSSSVSLLDDSSAANLVSIPPPLSTSAPMPLPPSTGHGSSRANRQSHI